MSYRLEFELPGLPKTTNGSHGHWASIATQKKQWRAASRMMARPAPPTPLTSARLTLTRFSSVRSDYDNLTISFKSVVDGLKDAGIILDDKDSVVIERKYLWERCKPKMGKIKVVVEEI